MPCPRFRKGFYVAGFNSSRIHSRCALSLSLSLISPQARSGSFYVALSNCSILASTIGLVSRISRFKYFQFTRLHLVSSFAHSCLYSSDSSPEDGNFSSESDFVKNYGCRNSLELNSSGVVQILQDMKTEPLYAVSFFNQLKERGFRHDAETYVAMIKVLCHCGMSRKLDDLFVEVINSEGENLCFDMSKLLKAMSAETEKELKVDGQCSLIRAFDVLIKTYARLGMFEEAIDIFSTAIRDSVGRCMFPCNFLMNKLVHRERMDIAIDICKLLKSLGLKPDVYTYGIVVKAYCRMGSLEEAAQVFMEMEEAGAVPNSFTYTPYLEGLCSLDLSDLAYKILLARKEENVPLDTFAYTTVIQGFVREKKLEQAEIILNDMEEHGAVPDEASYRVLIKGYCNSGDTSKALKILEEMQVKGIETNCLTLTPIICGLCRIGKHSSAIDLFNNLKKEGVFLDEVIYSVAIDAFCKMGMLDEANRLFNEMKLKNLKHDVVHYTTLINGHCQHGDIIDAIHLFEEMKKNRVKPDVITYNVLAGELSRNGLLDELFTLLDIMKGEGLTPSTVTHNVIVEGLCMGGRVEEARKYLTNVEDKRTVDFCSMVNGYCKSGNRRKGFELFVSLFRQGKHISRTCCENLISSLCLEGYIYGATRVLEIALSTCGSSKTMYEKLISELCRVGQMDKAQQAFNQMICGGLAPDVVMYTIMLKGYCQVNRLSEACALFNHMEEEGISPDIITCTVLVDGHCKAVLKQVPTEKGLEGNKRVQLVTSSLPSVFLRNLKRMKLEPDVICYTVLIDRECKSGKLEEADALFSELIEQGLQPDVVAYTALIGGYHKKGNLDKVVTLVNQMSSKGEKLGRSQKEQRKSGFIVGRVKEAKQYLFSLEDKEFS